MRNLRFAILILFSVFHSAPATAQDIERTIFRFELSGPGIGRDAEEVEVELFIRGGANLSQSERDRAVREPMREIFDADDTDVGRVELRSTLNVLSTTRSILVYGHVRDVENRGVAVGYIPVTLVRVTPGNAVDLNLRTVPTFEAFFEQSHPFRLQADIGLLNDGNAREILFSLRLILEYFLSENQYLTEDQWLRFNTFLRDNQEFLINGQEELVIEVLNYLSSSSSLSNSHVFLRYYGLFLKDLLDAGFDRSLADSNLASRLVDDLRRLYQTRFKSTYFSADNVLESLRSIGMTEACIDLARISLANLDTSFFSEVLRYNNDIRYLLVNSLGCALDDYRSANDGAFPTPEDLAEYLYDDRNHQSFMIEFVRVVSILQTEFNAIGNRNERDIINYVSAFNVRLGD